MLYCNRNNRGFGSLIGLLLAAAIIAAVFFIMMKIYVKPSFSAKDKTLIEENGIDTSSYKGILDSTKSKIQDINEQTKARQDKF